MPLGTAWARTYGIPIRKLGSETTGLFGPSRPMGRPSHIIQVRTISWYRKAIAKITVERQSHPMRQHGGSAFIPGYPVTITERRAAILTAFKPIPLCRTFHRRDSWISPPIRMEHCGSWTATGDCSDLLPQPWLSKCGLAYPVRFAS